MGCRILFFLAAILATPGAALAQQTAYLDDRSEPAALLKSLYNAINRREYARAYSYFSEPPAADFQIYAEGYADTDKVELDTGRVFHNQSDDQTRYALPVAIRATMRDGSERIFAGCYMLGLKNPADQQHPYAPLAIVAAKLRAIEAGFETALPTDCGLEDMAAGPDPALARARDILGNLYGDICDLERMDTEPKTYSFSFNYSYDAESAAPNPVRLVQFSCSFGAYSETSVFMMIDAKGSVSPLQFALPKLDVRYENDDTDGKVEDLRIIGYTAISTLVDADFDAETLTLTSHAKWRGLGDASSSMRWIFRDGAFELVLFEADASYDGEINPVTLLDYFSGP